MNITAITDSAVWRAFESFMAEYGLIIAALGIGFLAAMIWWSCCHPEDFEDADEIECAEEETR